MAQAVHRDDRADLDAGRGHREDQEGDAVLLLRLLARAHQAEDPVGMVGERGPDLLAVDDIVPAVAHRAGPERGEVRPGARFGIALAPDALAGEDLRQVLGLLRFGPEGHQHRPHHAEPEAGKPGRARQPGLLVEDVALHRRPAGAPVLLRPGRRNPAAFVKRAVPAHVVVLGDLHAGDHLVPHIRRQLVANEGAHLLAEVFLGPAELHRRSPSCHRRSLARRARRCHGPCPVQAAGTPAPCHEMSCFVMVLRVRSVLSARLAGSDPVSRVSRAGAGARLRRRGSRA